MDEDMRFPITMGDVSPAELCNEHWWLRENPTAARLWRAFLNLLFPLQCVSCGRALHPDSAIFLCSGCLRDVRPVREPLCRRCGKPDCADICSDCRQVPPYYAVARAASIYDGVVKECIHKLKYRGQPFIAKVLAYLVVRVVGQFPVLSECELIVPVPLHRVRERERGYNQAYLVAKWLSHFLKKDVSNGNLKRVRQSKPQTDLPRRERLTNVKGMFAVREDSQFMGKTILLIDDVLTTGSTVNECSRVLTEAGASRVFVLTCARGE